MNTLTQQQQAAIEHLNEWRVGALFMDPGTGKTRAGSDACQLDTRHRTCSGWGPATLDAIRQEAEKGRASDDGTLLRRGIVSASDRIYMELLNGVESAQGANGHR